MPTPIPLPTGARPVPSRAEGAKVGPQPPKIPTGRELYDALMSHIEPELMSGMVETLEETYKNETPENRALRMKRYALAFERCQTAYDEYMETLDTQVNRYRRSAFAHAEMEDRAQDEGLLNQLGNFFQQAAA